MRLPCSFWAADQPGAGYGGGVKEPETNKPVERMFPFVLRSRALIVGREKLARSKSKLHFVLITLDLSAGSRAEILREFDAYPIVERYRSQDLETFFQIKGAKVIGFQKSGLAQSIYAELKQYRVNRKPVVNASQPAEGAAEEKSAAKADEGPAAAEAKPGEA